MTSRTLLGTKFSNALYIKARDGFCMIEPFIAISTKGFQLLEIPVNVFVSTFSLLLKPENFNLGSFGIGHYCIICFIKPRCVKLPHKFRPSTPFNRIRIPKSYKPFFTCQDFLLIKDGLFLLELSGFSVCAQYILLTSHSGALPFKSFTKDILPNEV